MQRLRETPDSPIGTYKTIKDVGWEGGDKPQYYTTLHSLTAIPSRMRRISFDLEVKRLRARLVLGLGTAWEYLRVLSAFAFAVSLFSGIMSEHGWNFES